MNWGPNSLFANHRPAAFELEMVYKGAALSTWRIPPAWEICFGDVVALPLKGKLTLFRITGYDNTKAFLDKLE